MGNIYYKEIETPLFLTRLLSLNEETPSDGDYTRSLLNRGREGGEI